MFKTFPAHIAVPVRITVSQLSDESPSFIAVQPSASDSHADSFVPAAVPSTESGMFGLCCPTLICDVASQLSRYCRASVDTWLRSGIPLFIDVHNSDLYLPTAPRESSAEIAWANRNAANSRI